MVEYFGDLSQKLLIFSSHCFTWLIAKRVKTRILSFFFSFLPFSLNKKGNILPFSLFSLLVDSCENGAKLKLQWNRRVQSTWKVCAVIVRFSIVIGDLVACIWIWSLVSLWLGFPRLKWNTLSLNIFSCIFILHLSYKMTHRTEWLDIINYS